jgi:hypothetical protein
MSDISSSTTDWAPSSIANRQIICLSPMVSTATTAHRFQRHASKDGGALPPLTPAIAVGMDHLA